jgi:hypothetical protein
MDIEITPEGGILLRTGEQLGKPTTASANALQKSVIDSNAGLSRLFEVQAQFDPKFLTIPGKLQAGFSSAKEKIDPSLLNAEEKRFLEDFSTFTQAAIDNINRYIKEITGAQMSEFEADRLRKGTPDPERDGPTKFKSKMDANIRQLALARARGLHTLREGMEAPPWEVMGLDEMSKIIDDRAAELEKTLGDREAALKQVAKEFGL